MTIMLVCSLISMHPGNRLSFYGQIELSLYGVILECNVSILPRLGWWQVIPDHIFRVSLSGREGFKMNAHGCRSPLVSSCVRTAPDAYFEASHSIWKDLLWSGIPKTGSSVNFCFIVSKACWHSSVHSNFRSFFKSSFKGLASLEKFRMNRR